MTDRQPSSTSTKTKCPICKTLTDDSSDQYPFCSPRCKTIDLGRWADESYKITRPIEQRDLEEGVD
jgi:hypothetical protein